MTSYALVGDIMGGNRANHQDLSFVSFLLNLTRILPSSLWPSFLYFLVLQQATRNMDVANAQNCLPDTWKPSTESIKLDDGKDFIDYKFPHHIGSASLTLNNEGARAITNDDAIICYTWLTHSGIALKPMNYLTAAEYPTQYVELTRQDPKDVITFPILIEDHINQRLVNGRMEVSHEFFMAWDSNKMIDQTQIYLNHLDPVKSTVEFKNTETIAGERLLSLAKTQYNSYVTIATRVRLTTPGKNSVRFDFFHSNGSPLTANPYLQVEAESCKVKANGGNNFLASCSTPKGDGVNDISLRRIDYDIYNKNWTLSQDNLLPSFNSSVFYDHASFLADDISTTPRYAVVTTAVQRKNGSFTFTSDLLFSTFSLSGDQYGEIKLFEAVLDARAPFGALSLTPLDSKNMAVFWIGAEQTQNIYMSILNDDCQVVFPTTAIESIPPGAGIQKSDAMISPILVEPGLIDLSWNFASQGIFKRQIGLFGRVCGLEQRLSYNEDEEYLFSEFKIDIPEIYNVDEKISITLSLDDPAAGMMLLKDTNGIELNEPTPGTITITGNKQNLDRALPTLTFKPKPESIEEVQLTFNVQFKLNQVEFTTTMIGQPVNDLPVLNSNQIILPDSVEVTVSKNQLLLTDDTVIQPENLQYRVGMLQNLEVYKKEGVITTLLGERGEFTQDDIDNGRIILKAINSRPVLELIYFEGNGVMSSMPQTKLISFRYISLPKITPAKPNIILSDKNDQMNPKLFTPEDVSVEADGVLDDEITFHVTDTQHCRFVIDGVEKRRTPFTFTQSELAAKKVEIFYSGEDETPIVKLEVELLGLASTRTEIDFTIQFDETPNMKPTKINPEGRTFTVDELISIDVSEFFNDEDSDELTYQIESVDGGDAEALTIEGNLLRGKLTESGDYKIYLTASDGESKSDPAVLEIRVNNKSIEDESWIEKTEGIVGVATGVCALLTAGVGVVAKIKNDSWTRDKHPAVKKVRDKLKKPYFGRTASNFNSKDGKAFIGDVMSFATDLWVNTQLFYDSEQGNIIDRLAELAEGDDVKNALIQKIMHLPTKSSGDSKASKDYLDKIKKNPKSEVVMKYLLDDVKNTKNPTTPFEYLYSLDFNLLTKGIEQKESKSVLDLVSVIQENLETLFNNDLNNNKSDMVEMVLDIISTVMNKASDGDYAAGITAKLCCFSSYSSNEFKDNVKYNPAAMHKDARKLLKLQSKQPLIPSIIIEALKKKFNDNQSIRDLIDDDYLDTKYHEEYTNVKSQVQTLLNEFIGKVNEQYKDKELRRKIDSKIKCIPGKSLEELWKQNQELKKFSYLGIGDKITDIEMRLYRTLTLSSYQSLCDSFTETVKSYLTAQSVSDIKACLVSFDKPTGKNKAPFHEWVTIDKIFGKLKDKPSQITNNHAVNADDNSDDDNRLIEKPKSKTKAGKNDIALQEMPSKLSQ